MSVPPVKPRAPWGGTGIGPQGVRVAGTELVRFTELSPERSLPLCLTPTMADVHPARWIEAHSSLVQSHLRLRGALLFRGFGLRDANAFKRLCTALSPELLSYSDRSTPRSAAGAGIYTSTEYPPEQEIPLHNENAYAHCWPRKIWFFCRQAAQWGGETPLADSRCVLAGLDPDVVARFAATGVMYVRNYREGLDLDWRTAFQTDRRTDVEAFCRATGTEFQWLAPEHLRTRQVRQAVLVHPESGEKVWFNQAHLFHISTLPQEVVASLRALHEEEDLPRNSLYGDGRPIETEVLTHIRDVYRANTLSFSWQQGDALLLDNLLVAHGRRPFSGTRSILVAMAEPMSLS